MPDPLDIIERRESGGRNVPNYKYGPGFSASGYYQMINSTWRRWAKAAGIDISQYPRAIDAPREVQRAVAAKGFDLEGFKPWEATKHLVGQEANYRVGAAPAPPPRPAYSGATPMTMPGTAPTPGTPAPPAPQTVANIQDLQKRLLEKYPELRVTSGYRDPAHNAAVGGARNSQHTHGRAIDLSFKGIEEARQREIVDYARQLGARGLGYYPSNQSVHFDVRQGSPAAWGPNYSRTSLPQTPQWFQDVAAQHLKGGAPGTPALPAATGLATNAAKPFDPNAIPTLPDNPARGLLADNPVAKVASTLAADQAQQQQQAQAMAATNQAAAAGAIAAAQPPPMTPQPPPQQPQLAGQPIDYAGMLLPRLRRGLLSSDDYGMLGV